MLKWIAGFLGVLLLATNGAWLYFAVDAMVTEKYRQQEEYERKHRNEALTTLASHLVHGMTKDEVRSILEEKFPEDLIFEKEGHLIGGWLSFELGSDDRIVGVEKR